MSKPVPQSDLRSKIRSIEVALSSLQSRMQASFASHLSTVTTKVERVKSRIPSGKAELPSPQLSEAELRRILDEISAVVQKDVVDDTVRLLDDELSEFRSLLSRLEGVLVALASSPPQQPVAPRRSSRTAPRSDRSPDERDKEIASLREEVNRLYNLTEREPRFQAFWVLRDAYPNWVQIAKIARTLDTEPGQVHENLKTFEDLGLVEIRSGDARAVKLVRPTKPITDARTA